ncbi:HCL373Wp [Eremothecium sinecaudum]|uniref:HCL373Wp n=1 Tax=Eremothecium sinecaudum TaxID=45286 RepID=A0A109UYG9_9SACH|nr:HCL373Wp [Eremothecium sinecaudum]AMD19778.1 HCL373Wp [Eremothecium sinecaudum]
MFKSMPGILNRSLTVVSLVSGRNLSCTAVNNGAKAVKYLKSQRVRQLNEVKQLRINNSLDSVDPVLGKKDTPFLLRVMAELKESNLLVKGYEYEEVEKVIAAIEFAKRENTKVDSNSTELTFTAEDLQAARDRREAVMRILTIQNAGNKSLVKIATKLAVEEFARKPGDTGSSEVQAAIMTVRIQSLARHVKDNKQDNKTTRYLRTLVQQRQQVLRYLKRDQPERYFWTIEKLGLTDNAVMKEFNMDRQYMQDYKFFGDRILVKDSNKVVKKKRAAARMLKKMSKAL